MRRKKLLSLTVPLVAGVMMFSALPTISMASETVTTTPETNPLKSTDVPTTVEDPPETETPRDWDLSTTTTPPRIEGTSCYKDGKCQGHTITGTTTTYNIRVLNGSHTITLSGVNLDVSASTIADTENQQCAFMIDPGATVELKLENDNTLKSGSSDAGISVMDGAKLSVNGTGSLTVEGGGGAGIGASGVSNRAGEITIEEGTITATGGAGCAGIGGSQQGSAGSIRIIDGTITATGGSGAAGIGCGKGCRNNKGEVIISGGIVKAYGGTDESRTADGIECSTLGSDGGSATVKTNHISTTLLRQNGFNGMVWELSKNEINTDGPGTTCVVYGNAVMSEPPQERQTITVRSDATLAIPKKGYHNNAIITGTGTIVDLGNLGNGPGNCKLTNRKVSLTKDDFIKKIRNYVSANDDAAMEDSGDIYLPYPGKQGNLYNDLFEPRPTQRVTPGDIDQPNLWKASVKQDGADDTESDELLIRDVGEYIVTFERYGYEPITIDKIHVEPKQITQSMVDMDSLKGYEYTGSPIDPDIIIKSDNGEILDRGIDYFATPSNNTNVYDDSSITISSSGSNNYYVKDMSFTLPFSIEAYSIEKSDVEAAIETSAENGINKSESEADTYEASYKGTAYSPKIIVTAPTSPQPLVENTDYTLTVSPEEELKDAGTYTFTITGKENGNYTGTRTITFNISPIPVSIDESSLFTDESTIDYGHSEINLTNVSLTGVLKDTTGKSEDVKLDSESMKVTLFDTNKNKDAEDIGIYNTIYFKDLKLTGEQSNNYSIDDAARIYVDESKKIPLSNGSTVEIVPVQPNPPEIEDPVPGDFGAEDDKFTYSARIKERNETIYQNLTYEYKIKKKDAEDSEGEDNWLDPAQDNIFKGLPTTGTYLVKARSLPLFPEDIAPDAESPTPNIYASEFSEPKEIEITRLSTDGRPEGFTHRIAEEAMDEKWDVFIEPPATPVSRDVEYCILNTDEVPEEDDYKPYDLRGINYQACEPATNYIAYIRYTETNTHKESEPFEIEFATNSLPVETPVISFYSETDDDSENEPTTEPDDSNNDNSNASTIIDADEHTFRGSVEIQITCGTSDALIYYTTDGTDPIRNGEPVGKPIKSGDHFSIPTKGENAERVTTIKAIAKRTNWDDSPLAEESFTRLLPDLEAPQLSLSSGSGEGNQYTFTNSTTVTLSLPDGMDTNGVKIYYILYGSDEAEPEEIPEDKEHEYTGAFTVRESTVIKAKSVKKEMSSGVMEPVTLTKLDSSMNHRFWRDPFYRSGEQAQKNTISEPLMKAMKAKLKTEDKAEISEEIGVLLYNELSILGNNSAFTNETVDYYDLVVKVKIDNDDWKDATPDDFPADGLTITIDYPEGTSMEANDFALAHMYAYGDDTGKIETRVAKEITKTPQGLQFTLTSASPIAIAWTAAEEDGPFSNNVSDGTTDPDDPNNQDPTNPDDPNAQDPTNPDDPNAQDPTDPSGTSDDGVTPRDGSGTNGTSGDGSAAGNNSSNGTASTADAIRSAAATLLPKTGDTSKMVVWIVLAVACIAVIAGVQIKSKKGNGKKKH